ncbi:MAG: arylamine N-acetyltransferase [Planctomycetes bacterium]|nr:arylamine N-acetyltransferase [Planctomycetota bacterium]
MGLSLDAYFARIGYAGGAEPTLATLSELVRAHAGAIPFENLDVLLGRRIALDEDALAAKLVDARRGGYCFEQNGLLLAVLERLGFSVAPLSARVRFQRPRDFVPPRTHVFLRVELDGVSWLADVGVGGLSLSAPLRLVLDVEQPTPHETRRIVFENRRFYHQVRLAGAWHDVAEFTLEEMPPIDRELANWFTSAHPDSHFKNRLVVARALPNGRRATILNREFTLRAADGTADTRLMQSPDELLAILAEHFELPFPPGTRFPCVALDWP